MTPPIANPSAAAASREMNPADAAYGGTVLDLGGVLGAAFGSRTPSFIGGVELGFSIIPPGGSVGGGVDLFYLNEPESRAHHFGGRPSLNLVFFRERRTDGAPQVFGNLRIGVPLGMVDLGPSGNHFFFGFSADLGLGTFFGNSGDHSFRIGTSLARIGAAMHIIPEGAASGITGMVTLDINLGMLAYALVRATLSPLQPQ
ncbi:hypothetical protein FBR05_09450 [Deltaproteobacteria bacterium PRO3]|nr:hypothetical protein [Deltaproteobacteria bacterium PRO3]